jgi:hypothetical protein
MTAKLDPRHEWDKFVKQAQYNIDTNDPTIQDVLVIRMDVYVKSLELKIAEHYRQLDIAISREINPDSRSNIITAQLAQEVVKGIYDE